MKIVLLNLLYFYGMCGLLKECLLHRYFSKELRCSLHGEESDVIQTCRRLLGERQSLNVMRFLQAINERHDISEGLNKLQCKTLIFVGDCSPFHAESLYMNAVMDKKICALVEVQSCGSLVTEEHPYAMLIPIEFFLMGFGFSRQRPLTTSSNGSNPASPASHSCIAPELLSPESLGIKLKPIKTRGRERSSLRSTFELCHLPGQFRRATLPSSPKSHISSLPPPDRLNFLLGMEMPI
ncbi:unnamed protein product [Thlaspi arvense]|uniref:Pollen-specific protein SF21 n=1 Tax=Thlaspi arvense TaxID=13288 RepID=A0AAU9TE50_THLAR|nr:unnamed protein product [Thlaspi arvense]